MTVVSRPRFVVDSWDPGYAGVRRLALRRRWKSRPLR